MHQKASPREKEPYMRSGRAWMSQRLPCSFKKGIKMTQGKDRWSQGRLKRRSPRTKSCGKREEVSMNVRPLGWGPPLILCGCRFRGEHIPIGKENKTTQLGSFGALLYSALKLHKLCALEHEAT